MVKVTLNPLTPDDREQFIRDNQEAILMPIMKQVRSSLMVCSGLRRGSEVPMKQISNNEGIVE